MTTNRLVARLCLLADDPQVFGVELAVLQFQLDFNRRRDVVRDDQFVMNGLPGSGRNLVVVQRREDVLSVPPVDAKSVAIEQKDVHSMGTRIDVALIIQRAASTDDALAAPHGHIEPDFVRVDRALRKEVPERHGPDDGFKQIGFARFQGLHGRPQRRGQFAVDRAAVANAEDVNAQPAVQKLLLLADRLVVAEPVADGRVGAREHVIVNLQFAGVIKQAGSEVVRFRQRHVADVAVLFRLRRVIEAAGTVPGNAAQHVRVIVVLAAKKFLVVVEFLRQAHFVAGRTEFLGLVKRLQKRLLVEGRLGLDELLVDPLQRAVFAEGERVVQRLFNRVIGVSAIAVHVRDRVADRAGNACVSGRVVDVVEVRLVERSAEERNGIVTTGAPAGRLNRSVASHQDRSCFANRRQISRVVERAVAMCAAGPFLVRVGMAAFAVVVVLQSG